MYARKNRERGMGGECRRNDTEKNKIERDRR
jgi:hypothetical protein